jgi:SAM-dependent methyltransferase
MSFFKGAFGDISGGRMLDVATGRGGSLGVLMRNMKDYSGVFGIDNVWKNIKVAKKSHAEKGVQFIMMDAKRMAFSDESFDLVGISNSLHHLEEVELVLAEMMRVLRKGGKFVIHEPHSDAPSESQRTSVYLHHWIADIDTAHGFTHNHTFSRNEILDFATSLDLTGFVVQDRVIKEKNAFSPKTIRRYERYYIDKFLSRVNKLPQQEDLIRRGEQLRQRLHKVGAQVQEPLILIVGEK